MSEEKKPESLPELISVPQLPWYETLRIFLEPYKPAPSLDSADKTFSSAEIIQALESHHGVAQGVYGKCIDVWILPEDFVRAMRYLGYAEKNVSGSRLEWILQKNTSY